MYARLLRWQDAAPDERDKLIPMDYEQYEVWSGNARLARMEYLKGKLTAEEFLRRIDTTYELESYETGKVELEVETAWQRRVAMSFSFDPETYYPEMIQVLDLDAAEPKWEIYTADHLRKQDQQRDAGRNQNGRGTEHPCLCPDRICQWHYAGENNAGGENK